MPVQPTYPGVYIEEIQSGVRTITGVATSITAFIGYTTRGAVNEAGHIFSFPDFERGFGGLAADSPLSHAVKHFFQNGGSEAYVVRVATGAFAASVEAQNKTDSGKKTLKITAAGEGSWGNNLRITVDYDTSDPANLFNLTAVELTERNNELVIGPSETFRNLSMNSRHPDFVTNVVNASSNLIKVELPEGFKIDGNGSSTSGVLKSEDLTLTAGYRLAYTLNGQGPYEISIASPPADDELDKKLKAIARDVQEAIKIASPPGVKASSGDGRLKFEAVTDSTHLAEHSAIHFSEASTNSATKRLKLGTENGGTEPEAAGAFRPAPTGTVGTVGKDIPPELVDGALEIEIFRSGTSAPPNIKVPIWGAGTDELSRRTRLRD